MRVKNFRLLMYITKEKEWKWNLVRVNFDVSLLVIPVYLLNKHKNKEVVLRWTAELEDGFQIKDRDDDKRCISSLCALI